MQPDSWPELCLGNELVLVSVSHLHTSKTSGRWQQTDSEAKWSAIFIMKQYWEQIKQRLHGGLFLATEVPSRVLTRPGQPALSQLPSRCLFLGPPASRSGASSSLLLLFLHLLFLSLVPSQLGGCQSLSCWTLSQFGEGLILCQVLLTFGGGGGGLN